MRVLDWVMEIYSHVDAIGFIASMPWTDRMTVRWVAVALGRLGPAPEQGP
jgi:hypothetical protein